MEDLFKKFVNAGVGYLAQGSKSVQSTIDKLVKDNKMTQAEGKKIVDDLLKSGETKRAELEKQFQGIVERAKSTVGFGDDKPAKGKAGAKKPAAKATGVVNAARSSANQAASRAAGAVKTVADRVSAAAGTAQKSAAAMAGAANSTAKPAAKAAAKPAAKAPAKPAATATKAPAKAAAKPAAKPAAKAAAKPAAAAAAPASTSGENNS